MGVIVRVEYIKKFMKENHLSENAFAKMCKINPTTLSNILKSGRAKRLTTMIKITRQMGVKLGHIIYFERNWI